MKLVILSDIHLMVEGEKDHYLKNSERLSAAIARINTAYSDADLVVFAGDLADRGMYQETYCDLKNSLADLSVPYALTLGNHDRREEFVDVFGNGYVDENGFVQSAHDLGEYIVLVLDSLKKSENPSWPYYSAPNGTLCSKRLNWLEAQLRASIGKPCILAMHYPVWPVGIVMDDWGLDNPKELTEVLVKHGNVRHVLGGHIHMATTTLRDGIPFTTIAGNHSTSVEDFGRKENKFRREGPAQMALLIGTADQLTVHFDNYDDANPVVTSRQGKYDERSRI